MRRPRRLLLPLALASSVSSLGACTLIEGLGSVPSPSDGGHPEASASPDGNADGDGGKPESAVPHDASTSDHAEARALPVPTAVATAQANPIGLAVAPPRAYWVNNVADGSVMSVAVAGGETPTPLASKQLFPFSIAIDPPFLYFSREDQAIVGGRMLVDGGDLMSLGSGGNSSARWFAKSGTSNLYWTNVLDGQVTEYFPIVDDAGGADGIVTGLSSPSQLATDGEHLYWVDEGAANVLSATLDGATVATLASSGAGPTYLALSESEVFWTASGGGEVRSVPKSGGPSKLIASGESGPAGVAVDATYVYWADRTAGTIRRADASGGAVETIAREQAQPTSIAVSEGVLLWTNVGDGKVMKLTP